METEGRVREATARRPAFLIRDREGMGSVAEAGDPISAGGGHDFREGTPMTPAPCRYAIRINPADPARAEIAANLVACRGVRSAESDLVYGFRTARRRDEALLVVRGWAGTRSVEPMDRSGDAAAATPPRDGASSASDPEVGEGRAPKAIHLPPILSRPAPGPR